MQTQIICPIQTPKLSWCETRFWFCVSFTESVSSPSSSSRNISASLNKRQDEELDVKGHESVRLNFGDLCVKRCSRRVKYFFYLFFGVCGWTWSDTKRALWLAEVFLSGYLGQSRLISCQPSNRNRDTLYLSHTNMRTILQTGNTSTFTLSTCSW